jgi:hypothetical protein
LQQPEPAAQALPQVPQLLVVLSGLQTPLQQPEPVGQTVPQVPQLLVVLSGVRTPLQQPDPAGQASPHWPQLLVSVAILVHWPLQQLGAVAGQQIGPMPATVQRFGCPGGAAGPHPKQGPCPLAASLVH